MAYFANLDSNSIVTHVVAIDNSILIDENGIENEQLGIEYLKAFCCKDATWLQTSYNTRANIYYDNSTGLPAEDQSMAFRKNYAGIGWTYNSEIDGFVEPKRYPSLILNTATGLYEYPVPYPADAEDEDKYIWNEEHQRWDTSNF